MDVRPLSLPRDSRARCLRCGDAFDCGSATQPFDCWCTRMPPLPAERARANVSHVSAARCLCPACYAQALADSGDMGNSGDSGAAGDHSTD